VAEAGVLFKVPTLATHQGPAMSGRTDYHLLSSYAGLLVLAVSAIYSGSYGSLSVR
jgi:hypothetical protein